MHGAFRRKGAGNALDAQDRKCEPELQLPTQTPVHGISEPIMVRRSEDSALAEQSLSIVYLSRFLKSFRGPKGGI